MRAVGDEMQAGTHSPDQQPRLNRKQTWPMLLG